MKTALDTNILSALWLTEPSAGVVSGRLAALSAAGLLVISPVAYIELCGAPGMSQAQADRLLTSMMVEIEWLLSEEVWRLAAERFSAYTTRRRQNGAKEPKRLVADFLVGAHAEVTRSQLYSLDIKRYARDFPNVRLVG